MGQRVELLRRFKAMDLDGLAFEAGQLVAWKEGLLSYPRETADRHALLFYRYLDGSGEIDFEFMRACALLNKHDVNCLLLLIDNPGDGLMYMAEDDRNLRPLTADELTEVLQVEGG